MYILVIVSLISLTALPISTLNVLNYEFKPLIHDQKIDDPRVDGLPTDWPIPPRLHPLISIDGAIDDWYTEYYPDTDEQVLRDVSINITRNIFVWDYGNGNKYTYYKGEFIWFDAINDTRTLPIYRPDIDLTEIRVSGDDNHLYILVRVADLGVIGNTSQPTLLLSIPIDVDLNHQNGNVTTIDSNTNVSKYGPWDYQIVVDLTNPNVTANKVIYGDGISVKDNGSPLDILDPNYNDVSTNNSFFVANPGAESIEIAIAWSDLGIANLWNISNIRLYTLSFIGNGYGVPITSLSGSQAIDVLSNTNTDTEVSDQIVDFWVDIGFSVSAEPTYYYHYILDDKGYIQTYTDLANDMRTDYIVGEAFDIDILSFSLWIVPPDNSLYILVHIRGITKINGNITPAIAIALDTTPDDLSDGTDSWIHVPFTAYSDTELGVPRSFTTTLRSSNWTHLIWLVSRSLGGLQEYRLYVYNGSNIVLNTNNTNYISGSEHFIEAWIPLDLIDSNLGSEVFRVEVMSFAYIPDTSLLPGPHNTLLDIEGSNIYDSISPYTTYSFSGVEVVNNKPYAIDAEVYDSDDNVTNDLSTRNGDHWIDTFNTKKYVVKILNTTLNHTTFDSDPYIEIGEPAWTNATLVYYNGSGWSPLINRYVYFYLVDVDTGEKIYIGRNYTDTNGTVILYLGDIAEKVGSGRYYLLAVYTPTGQDTIYYMGVTNSSDSIYYILNEPFIRALDETPYISLILFIAIIVILLMKHYSHNHI